MLLIMFLLCSFILVLVVSSLFFLVSKNFYWEESMSSSFECGFSSYFFSRFSFSMHYFLMGLIFLFLDLELCFVMPFFNGEVSSFSTYFILSIFIFILILGIISEWINMKLEWKF